MGPAAAAASAGCRPGSATTASMEPAIVENVAKSVKKLEEQMATMQKKRGIYSGTRPSSMLARPIPH